MTSVSGSAEKSDGRSNETTLDVGVWHIPFSLRNDGINAPPRYATPHGPIADFRSYLRDLAH